MKILKSKREFFLGFFGIFISTIIFLALFKQLFLSYGFSNMTEMAVLIIFFIFTLIYSYFISRKLKKTKLNNTMLGLFVLLTIIFFVYESFSIMFEYELLFIFLLGIIYLIIFIKLVINSLTLIYNSLNETFSLVKKTSVIVILIVVISFIIITTYYILTYESYEPSRLEISLNENKDGFILRANVGSGCSSSGKFEWNYDENTKTIRDVKVINGRGIGPCDMIVYVSKQHLFEEPLSLNQSYTYTIILNDKEHIINVINNEEDIILQTNSSNIRIANMFNFLKLEDLLED